MARTKPPGERCQRCGRNVPGWDTTWVGSESSSRLLCTSCGNVELAEHAGVPFDPIDFAPVTLPDAAGRAHVFQIRERLVPSGRAMQAFELIDDEPGGYRFQVVGAFEDDPIQLCAGLRERMRALGRAHLEDSQHGTQLRVPGIVRGRVTSDRNEDGSRPAVVIDGREIDWNDFGRMWLTFEGWQFRLEFVDSSDEA